MERSVTQKIVLGGKWEPLAVPWAMFYFFTEQKLGCGGGTQNLPLNFPLNRILHTNLPGRSWAGSVVRVGFFSVKIYFVYLVLKPHKPRQELQAVFSRPWNQQTQLSSLHTGFHLLGSHSPHPDH